MLEPVLNPIWVLLFMIEIPTIWAILGGGIVILSILIEPLITIVKNIRGNIQQT